MRKKPADNKETNSPVADAAAAAALPPAKPSSSNVRSSITSGLAMATTTVSASSRCDVQVSARTFVRSSSVAL